MQPLALGSSTAVETAVALVLALTSTTLSAPDERSRSVLTVVVA
jgi:hypothetical protein